MSEVTSEIDLEKSVWHPCICINFFVAWVSIQNVFAAAMQSLLLSVKTKNDLIAVCQVKHTFWVLLFGHGESVKL